MKHPNDHSHDLKLSDSDDHFEITCSICEQELSSSGPTSAYTCTETNCEFIIHNSCYELPKMLQHKSHPDHAVTLIPEIITRYTLSRRCAACGDTINAFAYQCDECDYRIHVACALLPETVECKAHVHNLDLYYSTPDPSLSFCCDVCDGELREGYWNYYCKECDFNTHLDCVTCAKEEEEEEAEEEEAQEEEAEEEEVEEEEAEEEEEEAEEAEAEEEEVEEKEVEEEEEEENGEEAEEEEEEDELSDAMRSQLEAQQQFQLLMSKMHIAQLNLRAMSTFFRY